MKVAAVIVNYNGLNDTLECLESLRRVDPAGLEVEKIVVDNASSDGSREALSKIKDVDLIDSDKNLGYSGGCNLGIKKALERSAQWVLILNNDTVADVGLLIGFKKSMERGDIISPKIYFAKGYEFHKDRYKKTDLGRVIWYAGGKIDWNNILGIHTGVDEVDNGQFSKSRQIDFATGACMLVKNEVFKKIGLFDEKYFLYLEDLDFSERAKKSGFKTIFTPQAILWHKNATSSGGSGSTLQDYFITRNRLLFAFKYAKIITKLAVLKQVMTAIGTRAKRKALFDFLTFNFGKGSIS